jgi:hypothetical protein
MEVKLHAFLTLVFHDMSGLHALVTFTLPLPVLRARVCLPIPVVALFLRYVRYHASYTLGSGL